MKAGHQGANLMPSLLAHRSDAERQLGRTDDAIADAVEALGRIHDGAQPGTFSMGADQARATFRLAAEYLEKSLGPDHAETRAARSASAAQ